MIRKDHRGNDINDEKIYAIQGRMWLTDIKGRRIIMDWENRKKFTTVNAMLQSWHVHRDYKIEFRYTCDDGTERLYQYEYRPAHIYYNN